MAATSCKFRVKSPLVAAVSVSELIEELQAGRIRNPTPKDKTLLREFLIVEHGEGVALQTVKLIGS